MKIKIEVIQIKKDQESKKRGNKKDKGKIEKKQKTEYKVDFHPNQQDINAFFLKVISKKVFECWLRARVCSLLKKTCALSSATRLERHYLHWS